MKFPKNEASEKLKLEKVEKEAHKDVKDIKDKDKEKEGKDIKDKEKEKEGKDIKDKEKETVKDHKDVVKEHKEKEYKEKELFIGENPQEFMQAAVTQAQPAEAAAQPQAALKYFDKPFKEVDKPLYKELEKIHKDKDILEKIHIFDKVAKIEKEYFPEYGQQLPQTDPGGPVEQRLAALEAAVSQLSHFIPQELRPDLSKGALKQEPEEPKNKPAEPEKKK